MITTTSSNSVTQLKEHKDQIIAPDLTSEFINDENYGIVEDLGTPPMFRNNMVSKYVASFSQFSTFGKYYKSSVPLKISDDDEWEVQGIIHVFHTHVVLEYTYKHIRNEMWNIKDVSLSVSVDYSVYEDEPEKIDNIFLPCLPQKHMYIAVEKPTEGVTHASFVTTLSFYQDKVDSSMDNKTAEEKVKIKLKNLNYYGTYCIQKRKICFEKQWEGMGQNFEGGYVYVFSLPNSGNNLSGNNLSSTMKIVQNILGMYLCEELVLPKAVPDAADPPEVVPEVTESITCLLSGKYMGIATVLVKVSICFTETDFIDTEAVEMSLTYKCADSSVSTYIHGTVVNWLGKHCESYSWNEYPYGSLAVKEGMPLALACRA